MKSFDRPDSLGLLKVIATKLLAMTSLLTFTAFPLAGEAANPHIEWHKLETPHFEIVYDSRHYQLAKDFARHAETAWQTLVPILRTWPDKTLIVIDDSGDQANGMATGFPYPQIHLFPAPPAPGETIADTGPWSLELVTHEYTHVLNFQPAHGVFHTLRNIFGSIIRPNLMLPRWYLEGLAVETETRFSPSGGRLRSPDFTAIPRAMVQDGLLRREDIARIGETSIPDWPGGARPYLLGGLIWQKLARENLSIVGDLNDHYAGRVPFFIEGPITQRTGKNWQTYLESVYTDIEARATEQIETICENGCVEGQKLGEAGFFSRSPVLARRPLEAGAAAQGAVSGPGNSLAYLTREHNHDSVVMIVDREPDGTFDTSKAVRAAEPDAANRVAWLPDTSGVVFDGVDSAGRYEERIDLWHYDRSRKKKTRLSTGLRAREPDVSLDGSYVTFVKLTPGRSQIAIAPLVREAEGKYKLGTARALYAPESENRVSWPTFVSTRTVVFVERGPDGKEVLKALDFRDGATTAVQPRTIPSDGNVTFPRLVTDKDGRRALLFASNRSGVTNLYIADLPTSRAAEQAGALVLNEIRPLTNSTTRAWAGDFDTTTMNLIYTRLDGNGSHLRLLGAADRSQNQTVKNGRLVKVAPLIDRPEAKYVVPDINLPPSALEAHDFNVWPHLVPKYWMPYAAFVPEGVFLSASTSSGDPMGRHMLAAAVSTDTRIGKPNLYAAYANATTDVRYTIMADDFWQRLSSSGLDRRMTTADLSGLFFVSGLSTHWMGEAGLSQQRSEIPLTTGGTDVRMRGGPRLGLLWQDLSQKGEEVSPEKNAYARFEHARFLPEFGNQVYDKTDLKLATYVSRVSHPRLFGWVPERHVLSASLDVSWLPGLDRLLLGPSSVSLPVETVALGPASTSFVMRGYPSGSFLARKLVRSSLEYRMPLSASYHGFGTVPAFIRRWHGAVFADVMTLEGAIYDYDIKGYRSAGIGNMFGTLGAEARLDTTLFYHLPIQFILGVHWGFDKRVNPNGAYPVLSVSM